MDHDTCELSAHNRRRRGNNIIEFTLMMPWYVFLFVGAFDYGFFAYSLIAAQTAASVSATYCATNSTTATDSSTACSQYVLPQLVNLPNVGTGLTTCGTSTVTSSAPVAVSASIVASGPDTNPAASVTVMYLTPTLIPIPGLLPANLTITRTVKMRIRG